MKDEHSPKYSRKYRMHRRLPGCALFLRLLGAPLTHRLSLSLSQYAAMFLVCTAPAPLCVEDILLSRKITPNAEV